MDVPILQLGSTEEDTRKNHGRGRGGKGKYRRGVCVCMCVNVGMIVRTYLMHHHVATELDGGGSPGGAREPDGQEGKGGEEAGRQGTAQA